MRPTFLPYGLHDINDEDRAAVNTILKGNWITTGPTVAEFETAFKKMVNAECAVAVNSGTAALDIAVGSLQLPFGSEIITTPFTFVATANAIVYNGLIPVFADIQEETWNIDPIDVKKKITSKTKAIICVDYSGQPCDMQELRQIANDHNLILIEDAAHSLGATYNATPIGAIADLTTFSFHPVKHITTGEGGMVTTNNAEFAKRMLLLRNHGIDKDAGSRYGPSAGWAYDMKVLGRNYRIPDFCCALGISQLKRLDEFILARRNLVKKYRELISKTVQVIVEKEDRKSAWHIFPVLLPKGTNRDAVFQFMRKKNIGVNVHYIPVYKHSFYQENYPVDPSQFPVTEDVFSRLITLPLFPRMTTADVKDVVDALTEALQEVGKNESIGGGL